ncbi:MAG: type II toxin-antitoxin system RelE/ParE family toxin [Bacteroidia bacterium]
MEENLSIEWSEAAVYHLEKFYNFILYKWSFKEAEKFLDQIQEFEIVVSKFPKAFIQSTKKKKYRIGLIQQHVSAIYEIQKRKIIIVALIDNRAQPKFR